MKMRKLPVESEEVSESENDEASEVETDEVSDDESGEASGVESEDASDGNETSEVENPDAECELITAIHKLNALHNCSISDWESGVFHNGIMEFHRTIKRLTSKNGDGN